MERAEIEFLMEKLDIKAYAISHVGSVQGLEEIYARRKSGGALTGLEPEGVHRSSPEKLLENGKTVIAVAVPYEVHNTKVKGISRGCITNMAWEFDYHQLVEDILKKIKQAFLKVHPKGQFLSAVDTGPVNDRMAAYGAGLGWIGRNQFLINKTCGTGFYIGILITDIEVDGRTPWRTDLEMRCGSCRRCQLACPAKALSGERDFHGQRCLSTLTQMKRDLTYDECKSIGTNLYGCDICQWVCPYNWNVVKVPSSFRRYTANRVEPLEILSLSNKTFRQKYGHMGFAWRGLRVFKRNALIVMGNDKKSEDWGNISRLLSDLPNVLFKYGLWALFMIDEKRTYEAKEKLCENVMQKEEIFEDILSWKQK